MDVGGARFHQTNVSSLVFILSSEALTNTAGSHKYCSWVLEAQSVRAHSISKTAIGETIEFIQTSVAADKATIACCRHMEDVPSTAAARIDESITGHADEVWAFGRSSLPLTENC
jgi:hypothetical protein